MEDNEERSLTIVHEDSKPPKKKLKLTNPFKKNKPIVVEGDDEKPKKEPKEKKIKKVKEPKEPKEKKEKVKGKKECLECGTKFKAKLTSCPKCGSTNIEIKRENQGEVRGKNSKKVLHQTVAFCKDCGYTWYPNAASSEVPQKRKTWLWVLGWIFFFPAPVMVLIWRKKNN